MSVRVVIAEDEFLLAKNLSELVVALGHIVVGMAASGPQVIALAREQHPDLILMDIKIPEIDGITASRTIAHEYNIPIIVISAYSNPAYVDGAVEAGVMTYLIKPVSKGDLQAAIDLTLARHREMEALRAVRSAT